MLQKNGGFLALLALAACATVPSISAAASLDRMRLNEVQIIGVHQSYRAGAPGVAKIVKKVRAELGPDDVRHAPLAEQLETGQFRAFDFDIHPDPLGGRYAQPIMSKAPIVGDALDQSLAAPGFKVLRKGGTDYRSHCPTLMICLTRLRVWSDAHPGHAPLIVFLQPHDDVQKRRAPFVRDKVTPIGQFDLDQLEGEVRTVLPRRKLLIPDDVRGGRPTLQGALLSGGWPRLADAKGRIMLVLADAGAASALYARGAPNLKGKSMFANLPPGHPGASVIVADDVFAKDVDITGLAAAGYLVRTRADSRVKGEDVYNVVRSGAAFRSGAQIILTDYPEGGGPGGYSGRFSGGGVVRCNPVTAPGGCLAARPAVPVKTLEPLASARY
ncbi:MAG: Ca2+-dependent phosphoinositide-specific phospholipase C [Pseudomonadota bacterium]